MTKDKIDTLGWTIDEWIDFHLNSTPEKSLEVLLDLIGSQSKPDKDPAWISLVSEADLEKQWLIQSTRSNKENLSLFGVPIAVKDNIDVKSMMTTAACPAFAYEAEKDATVISLLKDAGCIIIGKTNLDQFATGLVGVRSPYGKTPCVFNDNYVSGGSSAGSASLVARGHVPIALGTDTAGSGRVPAALNNIIGLKPTRGVVSCAGVVPACKSLDCVSIFALNLKDAEKCLNVLIRQDFENYEYSRKYTSTPFLKSPKGIKIGIPEDINWYNDNYNSKLFSNATEALESINCTMKKLNFKPFLELGQCLYQGPWVAERYLVIEKLLSNSSNIDSFDDTVLSVIKKAEDFSAADFFKYDYLRKSLLVKIKKIFEDVDILCVPSCLLNPTFNEVKAEPILINSIQGTWTNFVNLADLAALAVPAGFRPDNLPNGITLIGKKFTDYMLLDLANKYLSGINKVPISKFGRFNTPLANGVGETLTGPLVFDDTITVAVVGAHSKGQQLHWQLEKVNAKFDRTCRTSKCYKLYVLQNKMPILKLGLRRVEENIGNNIIVELYKIPNANLSSFMEMIPHPLGIGSIELEDGNWVKSFICEEIGYNNESSLNITSYGGFNDYLKSIKHVPKIHLFNTILVANRGEIAVRIIKTLKRLNIKSVAIFSASDKYAQHVSDADISVSLLGSSSSDTYLNIEQIIKIAKAHNADGIIPGYGFLSENSSFAQRCEKENIVFIGPHSETIRTLGLKHCARTIAENANVPLIPGSPLLKTELEAKKFAKCIGYPIMIKSTAGGGGIGLQKVDSEDQIESVFKTIKHQATSYFGDAGVFLEKYIENSRHIEIQIVGDGNGNVMALGERDCSLQRRNQKIIEETPAPRLPPKTREHMIEVSERLAASIKYKSVGTIEYIYNDDTGDFYFLEVNTRLQVEHPITEEVTGIDLIEWMVKIAAGKPPNFDKSKIYFNGAAIEVRLYAENPANNFTPSPGLISDVVFPTSARVDTWIKKGTIISADFDPTLAKIIVHGIDRNDAIAKMNHTLSNIKISGITTNLEYLRSIISSSMFKCENMTTNVLNSYNFTSNSIVVIKPGPHTTIQDFPGRIKYWRIGVPRSGPMDSYSFRLANILLGNEAAASVLEATLTGPTLKFLTSTTIAITGGIASCFVNKKKVKQYASIPICVGDYLEIGKLATGCRLYIAIKGGFDVPYYLGSQSTFTLGEFGGYNGRILKVGDALPLTDSSQEAVESTLLKENFMNIPENGKWDICVTCGPYGSPDYFTEESIAEFLNSVWTVHYNSNRFGVKLVGPKPKWSRSNGGEAGLHPSNIHDYVYPIGAINFTGDEPVIITCDGPSLGGFVCPAVVVEAELWKVGQLKPGDTVNFIPVSYYKARTLMKVLNNNLYSFDRHDYVKRYQTNVKELELPTFENPILSVLQINSNIIPFITYRQAGDRYILIEYGENKLDLNYNYRIYCLINKTLQYKVSGIIEMSQGIRSILVEFDCELISQDKIVAMLKAYELEIPFENNWTVPSRKFRLPLAFEDSKTLNCVKRYQETIRSSASWLPNNVDFIARVNKITSCDVKDMMYSTSFMVLGLGDVYLGSPCAIALDPRHRLLGSKYNPARTFTERGAVGLGGMYMCIYAANSPGGYQLTGRTIPIWDTSLLSKQLKKHWMLSPFDQIEFFHVSEELLDYYVENFDNGHYEIDIEETSFSHETYCHWLNVNENSINDHAAKQQKAISGLISEMTATETEELKNADYKKLANTSNYNETTEILCSEYCGRLWKVLVNTGDYVEKGDTVVIIESMKTELTIVTQTSGKILEIMPNVGNLINPGDPIVAIELTH
ncbi:hypothetical protein TPHA_0L01560 [Tetrapisispora phaffii CBS 4417]|uniref:Urea amidolyase n=1 Tax=Tetrapisispora phaffii (strain ATCC 24235 / CBS 4417 / NBRC 1672 / NRRL Y-8282 / UCD 70-5) TaxID=1071381 RepID=G8C031_TETPH|nr:hypothetical protein TPHA_0L01560 [Tetrapisispora phaffii CBS 4417]CCE65509.1 hypothetical protein TPHA_0L01560 [Tetrapisispora phaffii CBS 4417]